MKKRSPKPASRWSPDPIPATDPGWHNLPDKISHVKYVVEALAIPPCPDSIVIGNVLSRLARKTGQPHLALINAFAQFTLALGAFPDFHDYAYLETEHQETTGELAARTLFVIVRNVIDPRLLAGWQETRRKDLLRRGSPHFPRPILTAAIDLALNGPSDKLITKAQRLAKHRRAAEKQMNNNKLPIDLRDTVFRLMEFFADTSAWED